MNESETRAEYIDPKLKESGFTEEMTKIAKNDGVFLVEKDVLNKGEIYSTE